MAITDLGKSRSWIIRIIITGVITIFIARLLYMQVVDDSYKQLAEDRAYRKKIIHPDRGQILDRTGKLIVYNEPSYDLMVVPGQVKEIDTARFCSVLGIDKSYFIKKMNEAKRHSQVLGSPFLTQLSGEDFGKIEEYLYEFPGFYPDLRTVRKYPYSTGAHLLGYVTEVDSNEIKKSENYYKSGDYIGKTGVEKAYENLLRGHNGYQHIVVDNYGREMGSLNDGKEDIPPVAGKNLTLGVDIELQDYAEKLMQNKRGAVVAIEPSTGEILCLVSSPTYDPNLLVGSQRTKNFAQLALDPMHPLNNRALTGYYPPGSQFKAVMALLGLQAGTLKPDTGYSCGGGYHMTGHTVKCHGHPYPGTVPIAIQYSCNTYFCNVLKHYIDDPDQTAEQGLLKMDEMLAKLGVGVKTGLDLPGEKPGNVPDPGDYDKIYGKGRWRSSNFITLGIGQDQLIITPLQNANIMACIANRGFWYTPHVLKYADGEDSLLNTFKTPHDGGIEKQYYDVVIEGLANVVKAGTATLARMDSIEICGKTGTAQNPFGKHHAEFSGFAPKDNPKIAIAVLVENAGYGGTYSAPIASLLIEFYLNRKIAENRKYLEDRMMNTDLINVKPVVPKAPSDSTEDNPD